MNNLIIGIAGGSGSGKTTLACRLKALFGEDEVRLISHDSYYKRHDELPFEERCKLNYDHPDAFDNALLIYHLQELKAGRAIDCPVYDYADHNRSNEVQHIVQAISHIDEIGIGIEFPNILLHLHLPLSFGIIDLRQLCVSGQHFIPYHISCCQFRDAVINAIFIAIILLGRIKHRGILCHVFCKHTGQKLRTPFCHFIPVGNFHAGAMLPCFGFVLKCFVQFFLQSKQRLDICIFETEMLL